MVAAYLRKRTDVPLILTCHGQLISGSKTADYFERVYSRIIGRRIFKAADRIISLSSSDLNYISSFGVDSKKISILPNAIDPEELFKMDSVSFEANNPKNSFLQGLNGKRIIMFVGPVIQRKGVKYLIKSIPKVLENTGDDSVFVLVGGGEFLNQARQLTTEMQINDHVIFTGRLTEEELVETYRCADLFVLPSLSEGLPTSILEAMYFGVPVVATDIPGVKDHFNGVALLIPPKNEDRLAEAMVKLLDDGELRGRLSKAGEVLVKGRYTWDVVARGYEKIYFEIMGGTN
jgi:glycosyltransferase involved in cell wall biosynthesis